MMLVIAAGALGVSVIRRRRATLAVHPAGIAASIVLFLPDGHAMLHFVDDKTTGIEGFAAVDGTHPDPDGHVAQVKRADAMDAQSVRDREAPQGFGENAFAFLHRKFLERFVFQAGHCLPFIVIANPTLETDIAAGTRVEEFASRVVGVDGCFGEAKAHQPPATGGMKTMASPALSGRDQSVNSLFTATFNCSRVSVNP